MNIVNYCILILEAVGVVILIIHAVKALISVFKSTHQSKRQLSEGITTALSFLLGGEVLKTIVAPDWQGIGMTCAILLMRAAITVLLHWESTHEGKDL
ncbi:MAG: DUF1622 domain-containing protein [Clostridia bacterium]|nr:DUF1622 domain-containing protein [Clostridia bacterium]